MSTMDTYFRSSTLAVLKNNWYRKERLSPKDCYPMMFQITADA